MLRKEGRGRDGSVKEGAQRVCDGCYSYYSGGFVFGSSGDSDNYWMG